MDYWKECIEEAIDDSGICATSEQIKTLIEWVEGAYENYGLATGQDFIPNPCVNEIKQLKQDLEKEKNKVICEYCNGSGQIVSHGPYHSSYSTCSKCNGNGRY